MPYLAIVHLRDLRCPDCSAELAAAGARSFVVDGDGEPVLFPAEAVPDKMRVEMRCANGHRIERAIPGEIGAEETLATPDDAPIAGDARLLA